MTVMVMVTIMMIMIVVMMMMMTVMSTMVTRVMTVVVMIMGKGYNFIQFKTSKVELLSLSSFIHQHEIYFSS